MMTLKEIIDGYSKQKHSPEEVFKSYLNQIHSQNKNLNALITTVDVSEIQSQFAKNATALPVIHKDIYSTKAIKTTAASRILDNYVPVYDATSVSKLKSKGFVTLGKANCDAFAHGATGEHSDFGVTKNPYDVDRTPGGSSSGSAVAVAVGMSPIATATDTGGSVRLPASYTNTVGIKPTYGRVSRYGIIAMNSSTDSIGHITKTVWDNAYVLNITAGHDQLDATSSPKPVDDYLAKLGYPIKGTKIGIANEYISNLDPEVEKVFQSVVNELENLGCEIIDISLPHTKYGINAYYIITPSEISSNLGRFDGIRFGNKRSTFGAEAKRRILMGTYCLSAGYYDAYYLKAQKVRTLLIQDFVAAFSKVDVILAPISPTVAPKLGSTANDPVKEYMMDALTVPVNLAGVPALAVPGGFAGHLPVGVQLIGNFFSEANLYQVGFALEEVMQLYKKEPPNA